MRNTLLAALAALVLVFAPVAGSITKASILATDMCVTIYENGSGWTNGGDRWTLCDLPNSLRNSDLNNDLNGLHSGCQGVAGITYTYWHNCVSSFSYTSLPGSYKVVFYNLPNYSGQIGCADINDTAYFNFGGQQNDQAESWRVLGGNC